MAKPHQKTRYMLIHTSTDCASHTLFEFKGTPEHPYPNPLTIAKAFLGPENLILGDQIELVRCNSEDAEASFTADKHLGSKELIEYTVLTKSEEYS